MAYQLQWTHCYKLLEIHTERYYGKLNYLRVLLLRAVPPATSYNFLLDINEQPFDEMFQFEKRIRL